MLKTGKHATPLVPDVVFVRQCYLRDAMPRHWSPGDLLSVLRI